MIKIRLFYFCLCVLFILSACQADNIDGISTLAAGDATTSEMSVVETSTLPPIRASSTLAPTVFVTDTPIPTIISATPTSRDVVTSSDCLQMEAVQYVTPITGEVAFDNAYRDGVFYPMETIIASLPVTITDQLTPEEFTTAMFCAFLENYRSDSIGSAQRLDDYQILFVGLDSYPNPDFPNEFIADLFFSVLPTEHQSAWVAGNGVLSSDGWIINKGLYIHVLRDNDNYIMVYPHTGP